MKKVALAVFSILLLSAINIAQDEPKGKIHGYMFGDYYYNFARDNDASSISNAAEKGEKDFNGFQFRRVYLGYDYTINKTFSTRLRLEANQSELTSGGKVGFFIKDAYLKWKNIFAGTDVVVGMSPPPTFSISESYWGYRSLAKTIMDLRKIAPSRDFGIALKGKISNGVKYWVMAANGEGNKPETNKEKRVYGHLAFEPVKNLAVTLHGDVAFNEDIEDEMDGSTLSN
ncbi:MAG: porin, partial [Melioribacteraceae bacterium]|nr:porin [Melioribacteraceae bacterium]